MVCRLTAPELPTYRGMTDLRVMYHESERLEKIGKLLIPSLSICISNDFDISKRKATIMPRKLHLSEGADRVLTRVQDQTLVSEGTKLLVYGISDKIAITDIEDFCHIATETYQLNEASDDH